MVLNVFRLSSCVDGTWVLMCFGLGLVCDGVLFCILGVWLGFSFCGGFTGVFCLGLLFGFAD